MKKTLKTAIVVTLFVSSLTAIIIAAPSKLFNVVNNTSFSLGSVTVVSTDDVSTLIDAFGTGTFSATISGGVAYVVINGQTIANNGQPISISLAGGFVVQATLTGSQIVVQDQSIIQGDKKPHSH